jgi:hypothetical protein
MRMLRCLLAIALVCGLTGIAKAETLDFHMVVLDPFATTPIFTTPFGFQFGDCSAGQLPTNVVGSYVGCYSGVNRTGADWIGLELDFSNTTPLSGQPGSCALDGSADSFATANCALSTDKTQYILSFTGGVIPNNGSFVIAEDGVDPDSFPLVSARVTTATTPEPGSIWLLCTGVLMTGTYFRKQAARGLGLRR